jgi:hypothetical protein
MHKCMEHYVIKKIRQLYFEGCSINVIAQSTGEEILRIKELINWFLNRY